MKKITALLVTLLGTTLFSVCHADGFGCPSSTYTTWFLVQNLCADSVTFSIQSATSINNAVLETPYDTYIPLSSGNATLPAFTGKNLTYGALGFCVPKQNSVCQGSGSKSSASITISGKTSMQALGTVTMTEFCNNNPNAGQGIIRSVAATNNFYFRNRNNPTTRTLNIVCVTRQ